LPAEGAQASVADFGLELLVLDTELVVLRTKSENFLLLTHDPADERLKELVSSNWLRQLKTWAYIEQKWLDMGRMALRTLDEFEGHGCFLHLVRASLFRDCRRWAADVHCEIT